MAKITKKQKFIELVNTIDFNNLSQHEELCQLFYNITQHHQAFNSVNTVKGNYPYISSSARDLIVVAEIIKLYHKIYRTTKKYKSFIDLGHGNGLVLAFIKTLLGQSEAKGFMYYGIDLNPLKEDVPYSIKQDLLTFKKYHEYDILYSYHPISDNKKMLELVDKVIDDMSPNTIFIFNRAMEIDPFLIRDFIIIPNTRLLIYIK